MCECMLCVCGASVCAWGGVRVRGGVRVWGGRGGGGGRVCVSVCVSVCVCE